MSSLNQPWSPNQTKDLCERKATSIETKKVLLKQKIKDEWKISSEIKKVFTSEYHSLIASEFYNNMADFSVCFVLI